MAKQNDSGFGCVVGLFLVVLAVGALYQMTDIRLSWNQVADYVIQCSDSDFENQRCKGKWVRGTQTIYTVNKEQQVVVSQVEGQAPSKLAKCAVVDRKNWKCSQEEGYITREVGFVDGKFWENPTNDLSLYMRHVSRSEWFNAEAPAK